MTTSNKLTPEETRALVDAHAGRAESPSASARAPRAPLGALRSGDERFPPLAEDALYGLAGRLVHAINPYTEADPVAILAHVLAAIGNLIGPGPHARVQHDRHPLRLNVALVGQSAKSRKGTAWSTPRSMFREIDPSWADTRVRSGLSSGEGVIYHVRDPVERQEPIKEKGRVVGYQPVVDDPGELDKRLLVVEPELASALKRMNQEANSLSAVLRQAWDSGDLATLTKNSPLRATGAHVSVIGHITEEEVRRYLTATEMANGFANRFCWLLVRRSKSLPEGAAVPDAELRPLIEELRRVVAASPGLGEIQRNAEARAVWAEVYPALSEGEEGLVGAILARAEAQVLRLSTLYAVLDTSTVVTPPHLMAALAFWQYAEASARCIFGGLLGVPMADIILGALRARGHMTRTEISERFHRHRTSHEIDAALRVLEEGGLARKRPEPTDGRSAEVWEPSHGAK